MEWLNVIHAREKNKGGNRKEVGLCLYIWIRWSGTWEVAFYECAERSEGWTHVDTVDIWGKGIVDRGTAGAPALRSQCA